MPGTPLAYHITFGTHGTRLHGDQRGSVDRRHNTPGTPIIGRKESWERIERARLKFPPVILTKDQRALAEECTPALCRRGDWEYHVVGCGQDHFHVLLSTDADAKAVRRWFKRWLSEELSKRWPLADGRRWWAEGGSVKYVWDEAYFRNVYNYIRGQRTTPHEQD